MGLPKNEEPCWLFGRAGFFVDLCQIVNYLPASLVRLSSAELSRVWIASKFKIGFLSHNDIPAPRDHAVGRRCIEYADDSVIACEGESSI